MTIAAFFMAVRLTEERPLKIRFRRRGNGKALLGHGVEIVLGADFFFQHLLARIALILDRHNIRLHRAKINTLGSRAEDVFWISGAALAQPEQMEALRNALMKD